MREIKFKALAIDSKGNSEWFYYGMSQRPNIPIKYPFVKASDLQYTGLKDKNGVEIYESDLVDMDARVHGIHGYRQVEFKDGAFGIRPMNKNDEELWWACVWNMSCEVIGNIYTHPHLLGSEKE